MTETMHIEIPVMVDFTYEPADPSTGQDEYYQIKSVYTGGAPINVTARVEGNIIQTLRDIRKELVREAMADGSMPRARYKGAM